MDNILKMLRITNAPTVPAGEDEIAQDVDEPPDDKVPELNNNFKKDSISTRKPSAPILPRRESLLTRAIQAGSESHHASPRFPEVTRGMSTTSSHSFASTAELTSDLESPMRSASPSPPPPVNRIHFAPAKPVDATKIIIADATDDKPAVPESGEAAIEKSLGRKRCIMFACNDTLPEPSPAAEVEIKVEPKVEEAPAAEPAPRKCRISFACPTRPSTDSKEDLRSKNLPRRQSSPAPVSRKPSGIDAHPRRATEAYATVTVQKSVEIAQPKPQPPQSPTHPFHEFASSHDETDAWVEKASEVSKPKLTIDDCYQKEHAIRRIGQEAEEEAEAEEREQEEADNEIDEEEEGEDDFAPSDEEADDGNESDDEEGFADSDSESDAGSDYQFWAPSTTTAATSTDNLTHFSSRRSRSRDSSASSAHSYVPGMSHVRRTSRVKIPKSLKMRPGTPELPDSTDFVCGTFDEDRPLEAAYISCREQRRREKLVTIPQDIDPSFPTTDPEDEADNADMIADSSDQIWIKDQFEGFDESLRGRRPSAFLVSPLQSPAHDIAPPRPGRPAMAHRRTPRSPPPKQQLARSPAPRRLFDRPPQRLRSPPPMAKLRSPRGSPTNALPTPFGITINHLAQRPNAAKTSSLPHTPNPFFRNWEIGTQPVSRITSAAMTPGAEEPHPDLHVRGPVDIVIGLEKKRQKRKEKFWRQHCRKAAKEQAEKKPPRGRGAERMKELGLECAERTKGYNLGQPAQLVLSL